MAPPTPTAAMTSSRDLHTLTGRPRSRMNAMKRILAFTALLLPVGVGSCTRSDEPGGTAENRRKAWPAELTFAIGISPENDETGVRATALSERIEKATGLPVKRFVGTSYSSIVEAMRARRIDGMETGVFSYLLAEKIAGAEAVGVYVRTTAEPAVYDSRLGAEYNGILITRKGSGVTSIDDLRGRTIVFGDPAGTSDHLVPKTELLRAGVIPDTDVTTTFSGSHASAILAVWNGKAEAAATADTALRHYATGLNVQYCGFPDEDFGRAHSMAEVRAVYDACPDGRIVAFHSAPIPGTPFAVRGDLPKDLKALIREAVLSTPRDPEFIREARRWYVDPSVGLELPNIFSYYDGMREMAKLLDLDLSRMK